MGKPADIKLAVASRQTVLQRLQAMLESAKLAADNEQSKALFQLRYEKLESIESDFLKHHNVVVALNDPAEAATDIAVLETFETVYFEVQQSYNRLFGKSLSRKEGIKREGVYDPTRTGINLPPISLPRFSGHIPDFPTFIDLFDSLVHNNENLNTMQKFKYLQSSLSDKALNCIKHFKLTQTNYQSAYDTLTAKYRNERLIAETHWTVLSDFPKLKSDNASELNKLLETFKDNVEALRNLQLPVDQWDFPLVQMIISRLTPSWATKFELDFKSAQNKNKFPTFKQITDFLQTHCEVFEHVNLSNNPKSTKSEPDKYIKSSSSTTLFVTNADAKCSFCKLEHSIYRCPEFLNKTPNERYNVVKSNHLCINCLQSTHSFRKCPSQSTCHKCKQQHHTLLHFEKVRSGSESNQPRTLNSVSSSSPTSSSNIRENNSSIAVPTYQNAFLSYNSSVLLSTALVEVLDSQGTFQVVRCLLDSGSMTSFISSKAINRLGLKSVDFVVRLNGLGSMKSSANHGAVSIAVRPVGDASVSLLVDCVILPRICDNLPISYIPTDNWSHLRNIKLADPQFNSPGAIDLLLGADVFSQLLLEGGIKHVDGCPDVINTLFGYVLLGKVNGPPSATVNTFFCQLDTTDNLEDTVKQFWEIEDVPSTQCQAPDDAQAEKLFVESCSRDQSGRFVVSLPFKGPLPPFVDMRSFAVKRFLFLENRLRKQPELYDQYSAFMREYLELHHMEPISETSVPDRSYYIPHHCVLKPTSTTTKLRVVFNASAKLPTTLSSLNDHLYIGPKLQSDLFAVLLKFRLHAFVLQADIKMMYRQIMITPDHQDYQRIVWRFSPQEPLQDYRLKTVTYGVSSAPFLAIRTLNQLADLEGSSYPLAAEVIRTSMYVDDVVTGCATLEEAFSVQKELINLLSLGGFELRKWSSNDSRLLSNLPASHLAQSAHPFDADHALKVLGLEWNSSLDSFSFSFQPMAEPCTKRTLLSNLARIFDPLGFISPVTFVIKFLIQQFWHLKLDWDESPPPEILSQWSTFLSDLPHLSNLRLPRRITIDNYQHCDLHCFGDASEKGYCAVVYFCFTSVHGELTTHLICSKTKVAPLKRLSLPRLELCAAVLATRLVTYVSLVYKDKLRFRQIRCWSDSNVALAWIRSSPHRWKTFVSNRVAYIQSKTSSSQWFYVPSAENPADIGSRGTTPSKLLVSSLWWAGPAFMRAETPPLEPPLNDSRSSPLALEEVRTKVLQATVQVELLDLLLRTHSSLSKITRILAYIRRFFRNSRYPQNKQSGPLTGLELQQSLYQLVHHTQKSFS